MRPIFRPQPILPVGGMQTYGVVRPTATHTRKATCKEVECPAYLNGWVTKIDPSTELGARQLNYIRLRSGRSYHNVTSLDSVIVELMFPPGQECFSEHRIELDRPSLFYKHGGDWRGRTTDIQQMRQSDWLDDFATHQQMVADKKQEG